MNLEIPQRQFTKEEINRCYLRWQQLRNEHGENAPNVPEFIYFTKVLHVAAKQQQEQQQQQQQQQQLQQRSQPEEQQQQPQDSGQNGLPQLQTLSQHKQGSVSSQSGQHSVPPASQAATQVGSSPQQQSQTQRQPPQPQQHAQNVPQTPHHSSIFTPDQSELLKAQITSLKCLVNQKPVSVECQNVIQQSISNAPDFKKMLMALSEFVKQRQLQQHSTVNGGGQSPSQQQSYQQQQQAPRLSQQPTSVNQHLSPQMANARLQQLQLKQQEQLQRQQLQKQQLQQQQQQEQLRNQHLQQQQREKLIKAQASAGATPSVEGNVSSSSVSGTPNALVGTPSGIHPKEEREHSLGSVNAQPQKLTHSNDISDTQKHQVLPDGISEPPKQRAPLPLKQFIEENKEIGRVVDTDDPDIMVDSYSEPPELNDKIDYDKLFTSSSKSKLLITPGLLPVGIDIHTAEEIYQTLIALNLDTAVDDCLNKILDDSAAEEMKEQSVYDYYALQLLPLQKAVRGHVLQFLWYQSSLLTSTHPNFLSKIRNINVQDALLTGELYKKHETLQYEKKRVEKIKKLEAVRKSCVNIYNYRLDNRIRRVKFGHRMVGVHANIEKEEQKRAERKAKERLIALKANDEEAYIKLLDQTKDTRITHLLKQTNAFLDSLTRAVKDQQEYTKDMIDSHLTEESAEKDEVNPQMHEEDIEEQSNVDYYNVAHRIQEEIKEQPSILVGGQLKEYQMKGLQWMVSLFNNHLNGILADEMGLGKTIQTISLLTYLYEKKNIKGPFLVIVPLSTLTNWSSEFEKWAPMLRAISYKGAPNERKAKQAVIRSGEFDVVLTTFEYVIKEKAVLSKPKWIYMIIDEGHRMKNTQSKLSLTLNTFYHADYRLILTGTPLQNNLPELWALLNFALPKIFNSVKSFDEWFNTPFSSAGGQDKIELSEEEMLLVIRRLHKVLRPFLLRRLKKDVERELPDKVEKVIKCKMSALQQVMYQQMLKHRRLFVGDQANKKMVGLRGFNNQIMQLKKICNHPFVFEAVEDQINPTRETNATIWRVAGKLELLERVLPKLKATGHRVLIFFQMTQIMDIMEDFLRYIGIKYLRLDGHTKSDERSELLSLFNDENSGYFCFILSTRAGGLGLNLQTADTVIIFDTDWNPHQDLQAQDRAHRIGQKNEVRILRLITQNSVEEVILERAHKKLDIDGKVIQAGKFDNKSTAEEQEALLRSLLDAEDEKRRKREMGIDEEEEVNDVEINELLARNEGELSVFAQVDAERSRKALEMGITTRLMENNELPEIYHQNIDVELEREDSESVAAYGGRGARERKTTTYSDNVSEEQWLKQFEISDEEEEVGASSAKRRKASKSRAANKKVKLEQEPAEIVTEDPTPVSTNDSAMHKDGESGVDVTSEFGAASEETEEDAVSGSASTPAGISGKSTKNKGRVRSRKNPISRSRPVRGRGRGRPPKPRAGLEYQRDPSAATQPHEIRNQVASVARELYTYALECTSEDDIRLSDIFLEKPSKELFPDYYQLIRYPIAFDTINSAIEAFAYDSLKEVLEDFHLIFSNARIYNTEDSLVYLNSVELEQVVTSKYRELSKDEKPLDFSKFDESFATKPLNLSQILSADVIPDTMDDSSPPVDNKISATEPSVTPHPTEKNEEDEVPT
ncbi:ZYBA0S03-00562g1_1 [Zygosaccharomyces bailii CLIB 213]|uniref:ZYBA0S03-00562g1_1 n=1 Tax=Zygosaccharomyces bailii (strain CLIB 213 / ATCC 58445 / CBS 680 / BCRC 21525 / NBRC 1098 / NCYC 1416 / NRRL Y-2227) TaxID=1333698 RepID=A0A8J2X9M8_ZYGB2|nr:ZYBA0S03-00562g1_1 [Zygosaccharomyces bailii CLIB 213]